MMIQPPQHHAPLRIPTRRAYEHALHDINNPAIAEQIHAYIAQVEQEIGLLQAMLAVFGDAYSVHVYCSTELPKAVQAHAKLCVLRGELNAKITSIDDLPTERLSLEAVNQMRAVAKLPPMTESEYNKQETLL